MVSRREKEGESVVFYFVLLEFHLFLKKARYFQTEPVIFYLHVKLDFCDWAA